MTNPSVAAPGYAPAADRSPAAPPGAAPASLPRGGVDWLLAGRPFAELVPMLKLLGAFDMIFVVACTLAFPYTLED